PRHPRRSFDPDVARAPRVHQADRGTQRRKLGASMNTSIGILGVGAYLPPEIRRNDWWPEHVVRAWQEKAVRRLERSRAEFAKEKRPGAKVTMDAIAALADDPFQGGRERRVMPEGMRASDMETRAAREAISNAGISKDEIDVVLSYVICPD